MSRLSVAVLGATGSIGLSTLDILAKDPKAFSVYAISGYKNLKRLAALAAQHLPKVVHIMNPEDEPVFWHYLEEFLPDKSLYPSLSIGQEGLCETAANPCVDVVVAAIVGIAGLPSVYTAINHGKTICLANKESLVSAGDLFIHAAKRTGARILPVDSEHNAIFQCLAGHSGQVKSLILTASGGAFRDYSLEDLSHVTVEQALKHPNWSMGAKVTIDSATMANKGLEVIEAYHLFNQPLEAIQAVIHPQSKVHSMVQYEDGAVLAQLGEVDMRVPISYCLYYPKRCPYEPVPFDLMSLTQLDFRPVDPLKYPCFELARQSLKDSPAACVVFNVANEVAVNLFQKGRLNFLGIADCIKRTLNQMDYIRSLHSIDDVIALDEEVRVFIKQNLV